jgi:hypothetical protein
MLNQCSGSLANSPKRVKARLVIIKLLMAKAVDSQVIVGYYGGCSIIDGVSFTSNSDPQLESFRYE